MREVEILRKAMEEEMKGKMREPILVLTVLRKKEIEKAGQKILTKINKIFGLEKYERR
ncbi:hypothetical protein KJ980_03235 [Patescibacteria group bacterium]|nr:hypothetical protein [Patescibacteria group bacterium]MBU4017067.1 hypothetical protein [Patescibacteria group bacterium]MBU4098640.1 hypothetical protein [Patescibacteria group bacterium]